MDFSEAAGADEFDGLAEIRDVSALGAGLEDAAVAADGFIELAALGHGDGAGFLGVNVLAGLRREHAADGVPAVSGGDEHGVDVRTGEDIKHVRRGLAVLVLIGAVHHHLGGAAVRLLDIANGDELGVRLFQETIQHMPTARADADHSHGDAVAGGDVAIAAERPCGNDGWHARDEGRLFDEVPACGGGAHDGSRTYAARRARISEDMHGGIRPCHPAGEGVSCGR